MADTTAGGNNYFDGMTKLGKAHKHFLWIAAVCYFFDQMDMQLFGYITPSLREDLGFTLEQIAQMNALNFLGMCLGGFFGGMIATKIGRKKTLIFLVGLFSCASIINGLSAHLINFYLMRFLIGFGVIGMVTVAMVYMAEMLPSATRGKYQALSIACGTLGIPFGALFANIVIATGEHGWRLCFFIGGISILLVPIGMKWLKESPRWLVMNGQIKEAEQVVMECTGQPCDLSELALSCVQEKAPTTAKTFKVMFSPAFIKQTIVVFALSWGATLGVFYISNFGVTFMVDLGWEYSMVLMISAVGVVGTPLGDLTVSFFSDKGGRRIPIIIMSVLAGLICLLRGYFTPVWSVYFATTNSYLWPVLLAILGVLFSMVAGGTMTMMWTYLAESYPTRIRSNATGIVFASARLIAVPLTLTVPATYAAVGYLGVNVVNALWYFVPAVFALLWGINSAQKSLEELEIEAEKVMC